MNEIWLQQQSELIKTMIITVRKMWQGSLLADKLFSLWSRLLVELFSKYFYTWYIYSDEENKKKIFPKSFGIEWNKLC